MNLACPTCREPVIVVSDVHLCGGTGWRREIDRLAPIWAGAATAVFNGDTINGPTANDLQESREILDGLAEACAADGVEAIFLAGNSDDRVAEPRHLDLAAGRVLVTHGDVIFPDICPWRGIAGELGSARASALEAMGAARGGTLEGQLESVRQAISQVRGLYSGPPDRLDVGKRLLGIARRPRSLWALAQAWRRAPGQAAALLEQCRPDAAAIILGHTHRPGVWRVRDRVVVNTGSVRGPGRGLLARIDDGQVLVRRIRRRRRSCRPGGTVATFGL